ncbi:MAG: Uma2 family endonuclease [Armatimonadetes bacterium]|nr:Uma2 family endonuclease [Armatimonadota bacterium]
MAVALKTMDVESFAKMRFPEAARVELVRGEVRPMSPTGFVHGLVQLKLGAVLLDGCRQAQVAAVVVTEAGFQLAEHTVRVPDVAVVLAARLPEENMKGFFPGAPDIAVEIVSPSDNAQELETKIAEYFRYGSQRVWVVYPESKHIHCYRSGSESLILFEESVLSEPKLLPGLEIRVADVFDYPGRKRVEAAGGAASGENG